MRFWIQELSIRRRIVLLISVILLPFAGMLVWILTSELRHSREDALEKVHILATVIAADVQEFLNQSEGVLTRLSRRPSVQALNPKQCDPLVADVASLNPAYIALAIRDVQGNIVCSSLANPILKLSPAESPWFAAALRAGGFKASDVFVGPSSGRMVTVLTYPIRDDSGGQVGLLGLGVDLMMLNRQLLPSTPNGAVVTVADPTRAVLLRSTEPEAFIGSRAPPGDADSAAGAREGVLSTTGRDGVQQLFAFATLAGVDWRVTASIPRAQVFSEYDATLGRILVTSLGIALFALVLAWRLSAVIAKPISDLESTALRVATGEHAARVMVSGPPEIRSVGQQFNKMLDSRALSEARLRGIFESAVDAIVTVNDDQQIVEANPAAANLFGCKLEDVIGAPLERFIPQRYRSTHRIDMENFATGAVTARHMGGSREVMAVRADGTEFPVEATISHLTIEGRRLYTVIHRDVSERRRAAEEVRLGKSKLEAALSSMLDAVFISDTAGRLVEFNEAFATYYRFKDKQACMQTLAEYRDILDVFTASGEPAQFDQWVVPRALRGETGSNVEYRLRRKDTGESWIGSYSFAPVRSPDGSVIGSVVTARDITASKLAQADLEASHSALQHLIAAQDKVQEEERKRIARELHDDLQQSLAAIRIDLGEATGLLPGDSTNAGALIKEADGMVARAIVSIRRIVNDLRPQMLEDLGLVPSLEMLAGRVSSRTGVAFEVEADATVGDRLQAYPELATCLYRVAQEALNNVVKHSLATRVQIHLASSPEDAVSIRIVDNGSGISASDRRKTQSFGLLGMQERVRAQGGVLRIDGVPDGGTVVEVRLPFLRAPRC